VRWIHISDIVGKYSPVHLMQESVLLVQERLQVQVLMQVQVLAQNLLV
jgi:hypothetical protein